MTFLMRTSNIGRSSTVAVWPRILKLFLPLSSQYNVVETRGLQAVLIGDKIPVLLRFCGAAFADH